MRRIPKQARSKAKVETIIRAAADQLRQGGYEGLSTAGVANQAGVSVGTLYQFFDNKDDLMQAIAEEHLIKMETFRTELYGPDAIYVPPDILLGRTIDWLINHSVQHPTFNQIFGGNWHDPTLHATLEGTLGAIIADLVHIIRHHAPEISPDRAQTGAGVLVYIIKGMLGLLEATEPTTHAASITEIKTMSLLYFYNLVGGPQP
ncbi:MAG: TetR/AcrR family transcriptional regulator [Chloroflexota bacterium]